MNLISFIKSYYRYFLYAAISNVLFVLLYTILFQFDSDSSCGSLFACVTVHWVSLYSGLIILVLSLIISRLFKSTASIGAFKMNLFIDFFILIPVICLLTFLGNTQIGKKIETSNFFCSSILNDDRRDKCFYEKAREDNNKSECETISGDLKYACRAEFDWDSSHSQSNP